ncbi:MAG: tRNA preQ1(34) S-adenosylmethionine ribosyltransferase-isomerase QueA [Desulfovibrio sp.]|jgi:S-adenosylmethionine:tRNA ribosyltransferase-isomerase|nr:tRNA preQ1(34) S-adenosylmethionine ribosyltransferase-isomerase QueA [Desulfovibrio sp.]
MPEADFLRQSYFYDLPPERVAQRPSPGRADARLMVLGRASGRTQCGVFPDILRHLPENCLVVANNTRVIKARLSGKRPQGGRVELLLSPPLEKLRGPSSAAGEDSAECEALLRPAKKQRPGDLISFAPGFYARFLEHLGQGKGRVRLFWKGDLAAVLEENGRTPLPPYIRRAHAEDAADADRYQTVYARVDKAGAVAAPTAGLHFTRELRQALISSGREWAELTLYVGHGTFAPVRCADIRAHALHPEYAQLPEETAGALARAKAEGRPVVALGTTSARALEGIFQAQNPERSGPERVGPKRVAPEPAGSVGVGGFPRFAPFVGQVDVFLYPGRPFRVIDGLITNFHLPESSLLMLVCAFAGRERVLAAYREAVRLGFRFFSYGDAMLLL